MDVKMVNILNISVKFIGWGIEIFVVSFTLFKWIGGPTSQLIQDKLCQVQILLHHSHVYFTR